MEPDFLAVYCHLCRSATFVLWWLVVQEVPHTLTSVWWWRWLAFWGSGHRHTTVTEWGKATAWSSACWHSKDDTAPQGAVTDPWWRLSHPETTARLGIWWCECRHGWRGRGYRLMNGCWMLSPITSLVLSFAFYRYYYYYYYLLLYYCCSLSCFNYSSSQSTVLAVCQSVTH